MPNTIEQTIAFALTPQLYDQFSAPIEHLKYVDEGEVGTADEIFYDLMYGMDKVIESHDERKFKNKRICLPISGELFMSDIKMAREQVSEAWRFVMIASYLLNGKEYCKQFLDPVNDYA
jgi:hypothetical protein